MKNTLLTFSAIFLFTASFFGVFHQFDPDFRLQFDRQFGELETLPLVHSIEPSQLQKPHIRQEKGKWAKIDAHALETPKNKTAELTTLVRHLCAKAKTDWERVRAIFRWIAENIVYDDAGYNSGKYGFNDANEVLRQRKGVCDDYADLFKAMAESAGLACEKVTGWSKGYGYVDGAKMDKPDHAWNAVFVDDEWHLMDVTWAAGYGETVNGKLKTTRKFKEHWFDTAPSEFVFKHLPADPKWQLIPFPLSLADFQRLPSAGPEFFAMGFNANLVIADSRNGKAKILPLVYDHPYNIKAISVPAYREFSLESTLKLEFECADCAAMAAFSQEEMTAFERTKNRFTLTFSPSPGVLGIYAKRNKNDRNYQGVIEFNVLAHSSKNAKQVSNP
jgi:hypothetical protein